MTRCLLILTIEGTKPRVSSREAFSAVFSNKKLGFGNNLSCHISTNFVKTQNHQIYYWNWSWISNSFSTVSTKFSSEPTYMKREICSVQSNRIRSFMREIIKTFHKLSGKVLTSYLNFPRIGICFSHALEANFVAGDAKPPSDFPPFFGVRGLFVIWRISP